MAERARRQQHGHHGVEHDDLEAALAVRRELGPEYEPALVESLADKIEAAIEARVDARITEARRNGEAAAGSQKQQLLLGIVSLGTGIPITAIAGGVGDGLPGVVVAWLGIAAVNIAHAVHRRRER